MSELRAQESRNVLGTAVHVRIKWLLSPLDTHLKMKIVRKSGSSHGIALPHVKSAFVTFSNSTHRKALLVCSARPLQSTPFFTYKSSYLLLLSSSPPVFFERERSCLSQALPPGHGIYPCLAFLAKAITLALECGTASKDSG